MPDRPSLAAAQRTVFGSRLGQLRRSGVIPANLVVPGKDSVALQLDEHEMATHLRNRGRTGLVELAMQDATEVALLQDIDIHPVSLRLQHVVFRHVDMNQPVEIAIPVAFIGEALADSISGVFVVRELDMVRIRCLPDDIPHDLPADLSELENVGDAFRAEDLAAIDGVEILEDPEEPLAVVHLERLEAEEDEIEDELAGIEVELDEDGEPIVAEESTEETDE